ncbi:MAG: winged helix-turn-helix domain-containing protein [Bacteroidota bacterium]
MNVKSEFTVDKLLKISLVAFLSLAVIPLVQSLRKATAPLMEQQAHLAIRAIGDDFLTNARDFNTPVPPLQEMDDWTLRLHFPKTIFINPDSLADLTLTHLTSDIASRVIVNVHETTSGKLVYGFEINHLNQKEIPCLGRRLPLADYFVEFSFYEQQTIRLGLNGFTVGLLGSLLAVFGLIQITLSKEKKTSAPAKKTLHVKGIQLDLDRNQIRTKDQEIRLTEKEVQIFSIFIQNEGQLVTRAHLTQEVWLNQGVMTSRSLDMYISRLRKKLKPLSNTEILNQRGKGYIFTIT